MLVYIYLYLQQSLSPHGEASTSLDVQPPPDQDFDFHEMTGFPKFRVSQLAQELKVYNTSNNDGVVKRGFQPPKVRVAGDALNQRSKQLKLKHVSISKDNQVKIIDLMVYCVESIARVTNVAFIAQLLRSYPNYEDYDPAKDTFFHGPKVIELTAAISAAAQQAFLSFEEIARAGSMASELAIIDGLFAEDLGSNDLEWLNWDRFESSTYRSKDQKTPSPTDIDFTALTISCVTTRNFDPESRHPINQYLASSEESKKFEL